MLPSALVALPALPYTPNGKIDRKALPAPKINDGVGVAAAGKVRAPRTPTESALAEIWTEVLHLERVGIDDDLVKLGADSIAIFQIVARTNKHGMRVAKHVLRPDTTIAELACWIDGHEAAADASRFVPVAPAGRFRRVGSLLEKNGQSAQDAALEHAIGEIWREVLEGERPPEPDENFFDAGGDSVLLYGVHARIQERLHVELDIMDFFDHCTIRKMAALTASSGVAKRSAR
jgi:aryl carrier-like protein